MSSTKNELCLVTLLGIMTWVDWDKLSDQDDETLEQARVVLESLIAVLKQYERTVYCNQNLRGPVTLIWLEQVADKITLILTMRYGCND